MHRFFVEKKVDGLDYLLDNPDQVKQILKVLRLSKGDRILVFDGTGKEYNAEIAELVGRDIELRITAEKIGVGFKREITLYQAMLKKDNFELVLQKAVELGASKIVPIISERCIKREISDNGLVRLHHIIIESTEQSGGSILPTLGSVMEFNKAIALVDINATNLIAYEGEKNKLLSQIDFNDKPISIFIGPEGGFTEEEIKSAADRGIIAVSLGERILRAETAAIAALARILI